MAERSELGRRFKRVRESRRLTLKAIEAASGVSATHISEIERGRTSPTVGALLRIAAALGVAPGYFLEDEDLGAVSVVAAEDRVRASLPGAAGALERLTTSIPGGRLQAVRIELAPRARRHTEAHSHAGEEGVIVIRGTVRVVVGEDHVELEPGDTVHFDASLRHAIENPSPQAPAEFLWVASERDCE